MNNQEFKESELVELKKSTSELKEAIISIVAILNKHHKGKLYFGIKNNGEIVGQDVSENTLREISKTISDHIEPKIYPKINKIVLEGKKCIQIDFEGSESPYFAYGRAYTRVSDEDKQLSAKELENLILRKNKDKLRWDNQLCEGASLKDIDDKTVKRFIELAKKANRMNIDDKNKSLILQKLELITEKGGLTNAGILVFGKDPERFFPTITLRCGRFKGSSQQFIDMKDFNGNLFQMLDGAMKFFQEHLQIRAKIKGLLRVETWEIPLEALREAMLNALIHRDYRENSFIYIRIQDDSLEISNPGYLPEELKINDLYKKHASKLRNPLIAKIFYLTGYIDTWGQGILNIIKLLKENNLSLPTFDQKQGAFSIKFKREIALEEVGEKVREKVGENEKKILELIKQNNFITYQELMKKIGISEKSIYKNIEKLKQKRLLKRIGSDKGGHWEIIKK